QAGQLAERQPLAELHRKKSAIAVHPGFETLDDIRVRHLHEPREPFDEPIAREGFGQEGRGDDLERDLDFHLVIERAVGDAGWPFAQKVANLVAFADPLAGLEQSRKLRPRPSRGWGPGELWATGRDAPAPRWAIRSLLG